MKYITLCIAGLSDRPSPDLDGLTPLQAADTPTMDRLAAAGKVCRCRTVAAGCSVDGPEALFAIIGFDPHQLQNTDPGPIEAIGTAIDVPSDCLIMRCDLLSVEPGSGVVRDHSLAGLHVSDDEQAALVAGLEDALALEDPDVRSTFHLVSRRHECPLLIDSMPGHVIAPETMPPASLINRHLSRHLPTRRSQSTGRLRAIIERSEQTFTEHEVNLARASVGLLPITHLWPWGGGMARQRSLAQSPAFSSRFGLTGCMLSCTSMPLGVANCLGLQALRVVRPDTACEGSHDAVATMHGLGTLESELKALAAAIPRAARMHDVVVVHVSGIDRLSLTGDVQQKIHGIQALDALLLQPVLVDVLTAEYGWDWRLSVIPSHACDTMHRTRLLDPVPCLISGRDITSLVQRKFTEDEAAESDLQIESGYDWMEYFLFGGLPRREPRSRRN